MTPETPMTTIGGGISLPDATGQPVFLTADHLILTVRSSDGRAATRRQRLGGEGITIPRRPPESALERAVEYLDLAVQTEDGTVIGTCALRWQLAGEPTRRGAERRENGC